MKTITIEQVLNRTLVVDATPEQTADIESGKLVLDCSVEDYATFINDETKEEVDIRICNVDYEFCESYADMVCVDGEEVL